MTEAVVLSGVRTPIGTSFKGSLARTSAFDLASAVVSAAVERAGVATGDVDDVVLAESLYGGGVIARHAALEAGLVKSPGSAVNRHCAGGLTAITTAAGSICAGMDEVVVAGGVQSSSTAPVLGVGGEQGVGWSTPSHPATPDTPVDDMSITVGWNTARIAGISRDDMDAWAFRSHQRAVAARDSGLFDAEVLPIAVVGVDGEVLFARDEHPRADSSLEKLSSLKALHPEIAGFSITAGNSSGINDGAAATVITSATRAQLAGVEPLARILSWASVGVDPIETGLAPVLAIRKALRRAGLATSDVDLWEINEAFAAVPLHAVRVLDLDERLVNPLGSGCSLGHPVAATGARMVVTLGHALQRRGGGIAVAAMCAGGGMASAVVLGR